ncbi:MAG: prepilin peptidase [Coriobacteriaceae bacterium]|nr:prepilin peptidase [Coriobacteriaceae bacterium]
MFFGSMAITVYALFITALLGLCMGSFLNCAAWRMTHNESVLKGRSHCTSCGHELAAKDLVPVFSWIASGGHCRYCDEKIPKRYIVVEVLTATIFIIIVLKFGVTLLALEMLALASILICVTLTDLEDGIIPNSLIIIGIVLKLIFVLFSGDILDGLLRVVIGGLSISLPLLIIVLIADKVMKKDTMGGGDIKLFFMVGMYFDWQINIFILVAACVLGIIFSVISMRGKIEGGKPLPFGPSIAAASLLSMVIGAEIVSWYLGLF